jgi:hypothetical protein
MRPTGIVLFSLLVTVFQPGNTHQQLERRGVGATHPGSKPDSASCLDSLRASDSIIAVVTMRVRPRKKGASLPKDFEAFFAQEFRSRLKLPAGLELSVMRGWDTCDSAQTTCTSGVPVIGSSAYATARSDGTLSDIGVADFSLTPAFSDSVASILLQMSKEHAVPFGLSSGSIPIEIFIHPEGRTDTVTRERQLFRVKIPHYQLQFRKAAVTEKMEPPRYPLNAERSGIGDTLELSYTILRNGTVAPRSIELRDGRYRDFVQPVITALAKARFEPASIGGCRVATWVTQQFVFVPYR